MNLHFNTTAPDTQPLRINTAPAAEDTFCPREYADLCEVVAATHLGGPLEPTVQNAVTNAYMTRGERWVKEAFKYLKECCQPTMTVA